MLHVTCCSLPAAVHGILLLRDDGDVDDDDAVDDGDDVTSARAGDFCWRPHKNQRVCQKIVKIMCKIFENLHET